MSCRHGWYGHGPWGGPGGCDDWYGPPGAYGPPAWYDEEDESRPSWRGASRARRRGADAAAGELEATLATLRAEMRRVEDELATLRACEE